MNGYQHLGVPLHQKPDRQSSPLRVKDLSGGMSGSNIRQITGKNHRDEEDEYERRRTEEIRKHTSIRDSEGAPQYSQATRTNYNTNDMYTSGKSYMSAAEREHPSSTHFTLGPTVSQDNSQEAPPHIKEHLSNIQSDNQSLMRRLNLVIQELDRVNREKDEIYLRLKQSSKEVGELQHLINSDDNVDKVNKYMSDDLVYERDRNHKLKSKIKELDLYRSELIQELRKIQERQDDIANENQQMTLSLQQKLNMIQDIEKEHYFTAEKIQQASHNIENQKLGLMDESADKGELQKILSQLIVERNDLLSRLEHLTRKYDECVRDISHDRADMERHNKQHQKLITAKIIFQQLEQIQKSRVSSGYQEFKQYCAFDSRCHNKLNAFAKVLLKVAHFRMRKGLRTWFNKGLEPLKMKEQSMRLAVNGSDSQLKLKMFILWKEAYASKIQQYDLKTKALQQIWTLWSKDTQVELKRSFTIWKETLDSFRKKQSKVKKIIWKLYFNKLNVAFNVWTNHSSSIDSQVRLNLLAKEFSQKQYLTIIFHNFKYQVTEAKRKRFNILFHCLKSWKDHLAYQKFLMGTNVAALQFRKTCDENILKLCFDSLRIHKEKQRFARVHDLLNEEELPMIEQLSSQIDDLEVQRMFKAKSKACESVKKMLSKQFFGYFLHWKEENINFKEKLRTTIKDKIIKAYMAQIRISFNFWKTLHDSNKLTEQQMIVEDYQNEQSNLQNEVLDLQREIQSKQQNKDCSQQKLVLKCVTSYQKRMLQIAIGRWKDQVVEINVKEDGADTIIRRMRRRYLRKAFDLYLAGAKYKKKLEIEEVRCAQYHRTRNERLKKTVMGAWEIYSEQHKKAKKYWYRMYLRLDIGMKRIALKKWKEWEQKDYRNELTDKQNEIVEQIENLNHQIGEQHQHLTEQQLEIKDKNKLLTSQARRIISNAFARFYYTNETRGFEKWKEFVQTEKHKEKLMKKMINHWRKYQFYHVKSCFQNWNINSDIQVRREQLKKEEMRVSTSNFQLETQTKMFRDLKLKLNSEMDEITRLQSIYNSRLQKSVQMIITKVEKNNYMSRTRFILTQWREYVKREINFIKSIQNVIQKSLWSKAFVEIRNFSRKVRDDRNMETVLNRFRLKFWKRTCGNAFSVWKSGAFAMISQTIEEVNAEISQVVEEHTSKKVLFKERNEERSERIIKKHNLRNLFQSWKNVTQFLKLQNSKDSSYQVQVELFQKKMAIWKWKQRKNATKVARLRTKRLKEQFYRMRLRQYFIAMRNQFQNTKEFCQRMSNLASIHDHQGLKLSLNAIISFAKSKQFVHETKKSNSAKDIESILTSLLYRKKQQHWRDFRVKSLIQGKESMLKSFVILRSIGNKVRHFFQRWKEGADQRTLAKEMHEEGPIREEVFESKAEFMNLNKFLEEEGYDKSEIKEALIQERKKQEQIITKVIRRMQHYNDDNYPKTLAFDRWKQYVHLRKLFRYWLGYTQKRSEYVKSDLHYAFDKWKNYQTQQTKALTKLNKEQLEKRLIKNNKVLDEIAENVDDKENVLDHLNNQREALVENYVKGQKLALSLWVNYRKKALHQAFLRWSKTIKTEKNYSTLDNLRKNMELIDQLKQRIVQLENENDEVANENEDLKQFSLDGYEIAKNVQALTAERENLSVDLADKSQVIRKLLDENDKLTSHLRKAQDEAQSLIRSTMAGSSGFKSGMRTGISPMTKSSNY